MSTETEKGQSSGTIEPSTPETGAESLPVVYAEQAVRVIKRPIAIVHCLECKQRLDIDHEEAVARLMIRLGITLTCSCGHKFRVLASTLAAPKPKLIVNG